MARLDQLIAAMFKHSAEALLLEDGQKPSLLIDGARRSVVKTVLDASHVARLVGEIAPAGEIPAISSGQPIRFAYDCNGTTVQVEGASSASVKIRPASFYEPQSRADASAPESDPETASQTAPGSTPVEWPIPEAAPAPAAEPAPEAAAAPAAAPVAAVSPGGLNMEKLLRTLVERGGSDLHLSSDSPPILRVDGELEEIEGLPAIDARRMLEMLMSIAPERNIEEFKSCGDSDFGYEIEGVSRFRANLFRDRKGPGGVFRVIPTTIVTVEQLGLSQEIRNLAYLNKGMVLVTGPTGSGKSTTLAGIIDLVNRERRDHVITIEDPIEFVHPNKQCLINQREVHIHTDGFKKALRAALREDPDVVLVGEMRDLETIAIALETAETGHLVFGTLHTSSAVSTIDRIIDQFPADQQEQIRIMLAESLRAIVAQVLCRKIGGGRCAALEVLIVNPAVSNLIREGKTFQIPSIMQTGKRLGMVMMNDALLNLVQKKLVSPQEAYAKAMNKPDLLNSFRAKQIPTDFVKKDKELTPA